MKATITQISRAIYDVKQESGLFPEKKAFDDLPHHKRLTYLCLAKDFIKVYLISWVERLR